MGRKLSVVLIEDSPRDAKQAAQILRKMDIQSLTVFSHVPAALMYLEDVVEGKRTCPDVIVLDLLLGTESGFEVLRYHKTHRQLSGIQVVVWTVMGETQQELCRYFGVQHIIVKADGDAALHKVLQSLTADLSTSLPHNKPGGMDQTL
jgi:CheY-like chemotaxis protein